MVQEAYLNSARGGSHIPPDPIHYFCSLPARSCSNNMFTHRSVQICMNLAVHQSLILFVLLIPVRYHLSRGTLAGLALKYFFMIHKGQAYIYIYIYPIHSCGLLIYVFCDPLIHTVCDSPICIVVDAST